MCGHIRRFQLKCNGNIHAQLVSSYVCSVPTTKRCTRATALMVLQLRIWSQSCVPFDHCFIRVCYFCISCSTHVPPQLSVDSIHGRKCKLGCPLNKVLTVPTWLILRLRTCWNYNACVSQGQANESKSVGSSKNHTEGSKRTTSEQATCDKLGGSRQIKLSCSVVKSLQPGWFCQ